MATVPTQIRIDEELKKQAVDLFAQLGLDMSSAMNMFLKQCVLRGGLPFNVELPNYKADVIAVSYTHLPRPLTRPRFCPPWRTRWRTWSPGTGRWPKPSGRPAAWAPSPPGRTLLKNYFPVFYLKSGGKIFS